MVFRITWHKNIQNNSDRPVIQKHSGLLQELAGLYLLDEERGIKNIGSIMMMESALEDIYEAETEEELEVALSSLASDTRRLEIAIRRTG